METCSNLRLILYCLSVCTIEPICIQEKPVPVLTSYVPKIFICFEQLVWIVMEVVTIINVGDCALLPYDVQIAHTILSFLGSIQCRYLEELFVLMRRAMKNRQTKIFCAMPLRAYPLLSEQQVLTGSTHKNPQAC